MQLILRLFPWRINLFLTKLCLSILIVLSFYGLYTNKFYFLKFDNYIFPFLTLFHFIYLYVIRFKITENELPDPRMRNLEYGMYILVFIYFYKAFETIYIISCYGDYSDHLIPTTFLPMGMLILGLYILLVFLSFVTFMHRKQRIGAYDFENMNNIEPWN